MDLSPDSHFLVAVGQNCMVIVVDCSSGELVYSRRTESVCSVCLFVSVPTPREYLFMLLFESLGLSNRMKFDLSVMNYAVSTDKMSTPGGLYRKPADAVVVVGELMLVSSASGDICLYNVLSSTFQGSLSVTTEAASCLAVVGECTVALVSGGTRVLLIELGTDKKLRLKRELFRADEGIGIRSISASRRNGTVFVSLTDGAIRLVSVTDVAASRVVSHTSPSIVSLVIAHPAFPGSIIAACSNADLTIWDENSLMPTKAVSHKKGGSVTCITLGGEQIVCGYTNGSLRAYNADGRLAFEIPTCHRGSVTAVATCAEYTVTGGADSSVRVWRGPVHVSEFTQSSGGIGGILLSRGCCEQIQFWNEKREIFTLKNTKLIKKFTTNKFGNITGMGQVLLNGLDWVLVTCHWEGFLVLWDVDYNDPVLVVDLRPLTPSLSRLTCLTVISDTLVIAGMTDGSVVSCVLANEKEPDETQFKQNPLSQEPIVSICGNGKDGIVMVNHEGLVMICKLTPN